MKSIIKINLAKKSYDILVEPGLLKNLSQILAPFTKNRKCFLISDNNVFGLYGEKTISTIKNSGALEVYPFSLPTGETNKNFKTLETICNALAVNRLSRDSTIIALGGGVPGDIAGFAAAIYMRGIDFIQIPTSLLAMVDSSIGGKTAIDLANGKNLIGAFWQPKLVLVDPEVLKTLPYREIKSGLAEIIKYGMILDKNLFELIEKNADKLKAVDIECYTKIIARCCKLKAKVVEADETEHGVRAILNYGHTFGHALETLTNYSVYSHGEAISIGMLIAAKLAFLLGLIENITVERLKTILTKFDLPINTTNLKNISAELIYDTTFNDKKVKAGTINFVIPKSIGNVAIMPEINSDLVIKAIKECLN